MENDKYIDKSGCIVAAVAALGELANSIYKEAKKEAAKKDKKADYQDLAEKPKGVLLKKWDEGAKDAVKGKPLEKGVEDAIAGRFKKVIDGKINGMILKTDARSVRSRISEVGKDTRKMLGPLETEHKSALTQCKGIIDEWYDWLKQVTTMQRTYNAAIKQLQDSAKATTQQYLRAIKATDGLTSAKPSVVKALERLMKMREADRHANAIMGLQQTATQALQDHRTAVLNAAPNDPKAQQFSDDIMALIAVI
jgi:hypothetical protein